MASSNSKPFGHIAKGSLHRELGVPQGQPITQAELHAAHDKAVRTHNTHLERQVQFAENARKFKH